MNERITFISIFDNKNLEKIEYYTKQINEKLCKVPFGKNVDNREKADTLPYHFTLIYWKAEFEKQVLQNLSRVKLPNLKIVVNDIKIIKASDNSYELFFSIEKNRELKLLQEKLYDASPSDIYKIGCRDFHISIHADKDYDRVVKMKDALMENFTPFELEIDTFGLYKIYPAKFIKSFKE